MGRVILLAKSQVKGYSKKDGTYVKPHTRKGDAKAKPAKAKAKPAELPPGGAYHPRRNEWGGPTVIKYPTKPSAASTWHNPDAVATFVPDGDAPASINGVSLTTWRDAPKTQAGWEYAEGINHDLDEPPLNLKPGKKAAAGVVIEEPDGRVWLIAPTNAFGGYKASFPKGTAEAELSLQANALKECWEEAGLKVEITGFIGDFERTTSVARMYRAKRVGGTPLAMGWESQAVHLAPKGMMYDLLNMSADHNVAEAVGAGPKPKPKPKPAGSKYQGGYKAKPNGPKPKTGSLFPDWDDDSDSSWDGWSGHKKGGGQSSLF